MYNVAKPNQTSSKMLQLLQTAEATPNFSRGDNIMQHQTFQIAVFVWLTAGLGLSAFLFFYLELRLILSIILT